MPDKRVYLKSGITGGGADDLDGIDGAGLSAGDGAFVLASDLAHIYLLKESGATAAPPGIIAPAAGAGNKRWHLQGAAALNAVGRTFLAQTTAADMARTLLAAPVGSVSGRLDFATFLDVEMPADLHDGNTSDAVCLRINVTGADRTLTGFFSGVLPEGRELILYNVGTYNLILAHNDSRSGAARRILLPNNAMMVIPPAGTVTLRYDSTASRWRVTSAGVETPLFGSNANGQWYRFSNGMQVCTAALNLGSRVALGAGTYADPYRTALLATWTFPAAFVSPPEIVDGTTVDTATGLARANLLSIRSVDATSATSIQATAVTANNTNVDVIARLIAIGRWK